MSRHLAANADNEYATLDSIIVRAHQHSAGAQNTGEDQAIGRSRGGSSARIHALADALGTPIGSYLTGGEAHDLVGADHLLPGMQAEALIADKAFDADARVRAPLAAAGKTAVIPPISNRREPSDYDREVRKPRHLIESFFAKPKQFRVIAARTDKTARNVLAAIHPAATAIWLKMTTRPGVLPPKFGALHGERRG